MLSPCSYDAHAFLDHEADHFIGYQVFLRMARYILRIGNDDEGGRSVWTVDDLNLLGSAHLVQASVI
ncbi:hypothetical protein D3C76_1570670 [compost metagenome]